MSERCLVTGLGAVLQLSVLVAEALPCPLLVPRHSSGEGTGCGAPSGRRKSCMDTAQVSGLQWVVFSCR